MNEVAVIATIETAPGSREAVLEMILEHRARCLADEPGTLLFEVMIPNDEPDKLMLYEVYRNRAAFDAHWNGQSLSRLRLETGERMSIKSGLWGIPAVVPAKPQQ